MPAVEQHPIREVDFDAKARDLDALQPGTTLDGKYQIKQLIGTGGMGSVYLAHHLQIDKDVAIKVLHPRYAADPEGLKRFQREARIISGLRHRNIMLNYAFGHVNGLVYMVTEFVEGKSLGAIVRSEGPLPPAQALPLLLQICDAMLYAHEHDVFHRDLKPDNVIVVETTPILIDFGLAKLLDGTDGQRLTRTGEVVGDPHYMSPEQAQGQQLDKRSDVYSFGCLMYEVLTGEQPFVADSPVAVLMKQISEHPAPFPAHCKLPSALEAIVFTAMSKNRDARFDSFQEVRDILAQFIANPDIKIKPPSRQRSALSGGVSDSSKRILIAAGLMLLVATAVGTWCFVENSRRQNERDAEQAIAEEKLRDFLTNYHGQDLDEIIRLGKKWHDAAAVARAQFLLAEYHLSVDNYVRAMDTANDSLNGAAVTRQEAAAFKNVYAESARRLHRLGDAERVFKDLYLHQADEVRSPEKQIQLLLRLADVEADLGKVDEAARLTHEAEDRYGNIMLPRVWPGGSPSPDQILFDLATLHVKLHEFDRAEKLIKTMDLSWVIQPSSLNPNAELNMKLQAARGNYAALDNYTHQVLSAQVDGDSKLLALSAICNSLSDAKQFDRAQKVLREMAQISKSLGRPGLDAPYGAVVKLTTMHLEEAQGHYEQVAAEATKLLPTLLNHPYYAKPVYECVDLLYDALHHLGRESELATIYSQLRDYPHTGRSTGENLRGRRAPSN